MPRNYDWNGDPMGELGEAYSRVNYPPPKGSGLQVS